MKTVIYEFLTQSGIFYYVKSNLDIDMVSAMFRLTLKESIVSGCELEVANKFEEKDVINFEIIKYDNSN